MHKEFDKRMRNEITFKEIRIPYKIMHITKSYNFRDLATLKFLCAGRFWDVRWTSGYYFDDKTDKSIKHKFINP